MSVMLALGAAVVFGSADFLGGLATGFIGGFLALWISRWKVPKGVRGVMPVVVTPLLSADDIETLAFEGLKKFEPGTANHEGLAGWLGSLAEGRRPGRRPGRGRRRCSGRFRSHR